MGFNDLTRERLSQNAKKSPSYIQPQKCTYTYTYNGIHVAVPRTAEYLIQGLDIQQCNARFRCGPKGHLFINTEIFTHYLIRLQVCLDWGQMENILLMF